MFSQLISTNYLGFLIFDIAIIKLTVLLLYRVFFLYKNFYYVINDRGVKVFGFRSKCGHIQVIYISKKKILNIYSNRDRLSLRTQNCISLIKIVQKSFIFIFWYPLFFISISNSTNKTRRIQFSV